MLSQDIKEKFQIVFVPSLTCLLLFILIYPLLVWLFVIKLGWIHIKSIMLEFGIPALAAGVIYLVFLKNRFHLFRLQSKDRDDTAHFGIGIGSIIFLAFPVIVTISHLTKYSYELISLTSPFEAKYEDNERYYKFSKTYFDSKYTLVYPEVHASGKYNQDLVFSYYVICPILGEKDKYPSGTITHWYAVKYEEKISNRESDSKKNQLYEEFIRQSKTKWLADNHTDIHYYERVQLSDDQDNYINAGSTLNYYNPKSIFFEPRYEPFEKRVDSNFTWIFISLGLSLLWFTIFSFAPKFSALRINKYRNNQEVVDEEFNSFLKFFIPKDKRYMTTLLIDINIIYFIIMLFCGAGFTYSSIDELINLGGVGYEEVAAGQYWRFVTGIFVHANIIHLVYNMIGLTLGGLFLEGIIGRSKMLIVFLTTGILAFVASLYFSEARVAVGASGAIFGLYGVLLGLLLTKAIPKGVKAFLWKFIGIYAGLSLLFGFLTPQIDNAAHISGLVTGALLGLIFYFFDLLPKNEVKTEEEMLN